MSDNQLEPLGDLESVCRDIYERWDTDQRAGKLLAALCGTVSNYDPRVTRIREALTRSKQTEPVGDEVVENGARAIAAVIARRHEHYHAGTEPRLTRIEDWLNDERREEARACLASLKGNQHVG